MICAPSIHVKMAVVAITMATHILAIVNRTTWVTCVKVCIMCLKVCVIGMYIYLHASMYLSIVMKTKPYLIRSSRLVSVVRIRWCNVHRWLISQRGNSAYIAAVVVS